LKKERGETMSVDLENKVETARPSGTAAKPPPPPPLQPFPSFATLDEIESHMGGGTRQRTLSKAAALAAGAVLFGLLYAIVSAIQ
jgi:hypothetical protein